MSSEISSMKVNEIIDKLTFSYEKLVKNGIPFKNMPSVMLWGPPGVGKSQLVREVAEELEDRTKKKVSVTDVRLMLFNPVDLRGIPTANAEKTLAVWLKPKIFDMDESSDVINILFLDEISAAPQSVQAAAYQITLDRIIGEHKLPDNCLVIAAGNRVTDKSVAYKMPRALANRLLHIEVAPSFDSWLDWAISHGINKKVIGFLSFRENYLYDSEMQADNLAFTTPRSWEMVSNILNNISDDMQFVYPMIVGLIGCGVASEFRSWCKIYGGLPDIKKIFSGQENIIPKECDRLYALVSSMIEFARDNQEDITKIENSLYYALKLPPDFSAVLLQGYQSISKDFRKELLTMPAYVKWYETRGKLLNGHI